VVAQRTEREQNRCEDNCPDDAVRVDVADPLLNEQLPDVAGNGAVRRRCDDADAGVVLRQQGCFGADKNPDQ
jgi:hypothetical protein